MFGLLTKIFDNQKAHTAKRCLQMPPKDYTDALPWETLLCIRGATWPAYRLFDVPATDLATGWAQAAKKAGTFTMAPCGKFCYLNVRVPKGLLLTNVMGSRFGEMVFDADTIVPSLYRRQTGCGPDHNLEDPDGWAHSPWMSIMPQELFTLRPGTRLAKGHVVVAGLGLGYQLCKVAARKQVKRITLVETSAELVKWILPRLDLCGRKVEVVLGNAFELVPKMEADVALVDVFPHYGGNEFPTCPKIGRVWVWGSSEVRDAPCYGW